MMLRVENVSKAFGGLRALSGVTFEAPQGTIMGLIGPNGAGKTTLFNIINGVYPADAGRVTFRGGEITGLAPYRVARLGLARTHQVVRPLSDLTVLENAMLGACFGREHHSIASARGVAFDALALVGLAARAQQAAGTLNLSEKKRLELARALAARPYLILLDEVLAGLNPSEVTRMLQIVRGIRDGGVTILLIEHVMQAVMSISDRVVVLESGRIIAEGTPQEVVTDPLVMEAYLGDPKLAEQMMEL